MRVIEEGNYGNTFPMTVECKRVVDRYGFAYGDTKDFCVSMETLEALTDLLERAEDYYHYNNLYDKKLVINKEDLLNIVTDLKLGR